jgi:hypothetical protein
MFLPNQKPETRNSEFIQRRWNLRLWSLHPKYLDRQGLTAVWREGLLAQKVLQGRTKGYRSHPQLSRFRACSDPVAAIGCYLMEIAREADRRGYRFDTSKIEKPGHGRKMTVSRGQVDYEWAHLLKKLKGRSQAVHEIQEQIIHPETHPLFTIVPGGIEEWERV